MQTLFPENIIFQTLNINTPKKNIFIFFQYLEILLSTFNIIKILKDKKNQS